MRILIDLQALQTESRFRGIGRYSLSFAKALLRNAGNHEVWVALNGAFPEAIGNIRTELSGLIDEDRICEFSTFRKIGWPDHSDEWRRKASECMWEAFLESLQPDVVHISSLFEGSQGGAVNSIGKLPESQVLTSMTLYDLIPFLNQETYLGTEWVRAWYMDKLDSLKRSGLLLSISEYARSEALKALEIEPGRIVNMSSAISTKFQPKHIGEPEVDFLRERFGINDRYAMYSGAMEPRKNAEGLIAAFSLLGGRTRQEVQLVIAGKISKYDEERFRHLSQKLGIAERVVFTGFVTDDELITLYSAASVYVFPSFHEGFGLPALEAMACGAPTIGSNTTSIPEVIAHPDALFNPYDSSSIASLMDRVFNDDSFAAELRAHGLRQAQCFSWDRTARTALEAMEKCVADRISPQRHWPNSMAAVQETYGRLIRSLGSLQAAIGPSDTELEEAAVLIANGFGENNARARAGILPRSLRWRIEGPFDSSYSLALVNRYIALALAARQNIVGLHSTEGPGDFDPSENFLKANPRVAELHENIGKISPCEADVTSRLLYPPRVHDVRSRINILHAYAWEESCFPEPWVADFNDTLQGISCLSQHVRKIMIDNGVSVPLGVCGSGVDHWDDIAVDQTYMIPGKGFRFLHVSSCFPRKGVDSLLKAYGQEFTQDDQVSLIIKTFPNPHNEVHKWLSEARKDNPKYPDVHIIEDDIGDAQLKHLYASCHALVAPSRAEGFGLPLAEAMLMKLPVITTAWGGQLDFCNEETAWLVDYRFAPAQTHFNLRHSVWAEPDIGALGTAMREVQEAGPQLLGVRTGVAERVLRSRFKWADTARRLEEDVRHFAARPTLPVARIGWLTTWNTPCGIATYAKHLVAGMSPPTAILAADAEQRISPDGPEVVRCWQQGDSSFARLDAEIKRLNLNTIIVQFQYGFFDFEAFSVFLNRQRAAGLTIIVMMHATVDPEKQPRKKLRLLAKTLSACDRVLVHSVQDLNRLKEVGAERNAAIFPHGIMDSFLGSPHSFGGKLKIASYGFFLPHKGLLELIDAVALLVENGMDVELSMLNAEYPQKISREQISLAKQKISERDLSSRIHMNTGYLRDEESLAELNRADVIIFPYQETGESSSAAVRHGLASGRPVVVTPLRIFDDVADIVHCLPGTSPLDIANGLRDLFSKMTKNDAEFAEKSERVSAWCAEHRYPRLSKRLEMIARQLLRSHSDTEFKID